MHVAVLYELYHLLIMYVGGDTSFPLIYTLSMFTNYGV